MESKRHKWVASSSLLPTDPSVLFTTAGMQQFKSYYTDPSSAPALSVASIQKCMRTSDIDEVGDESHLTFFEMLGNFSFGGYWKKEAIELAYEFITKEMGLRIDYVTVFGGDETVPRDKESAEVWMTIDPNLNIIDGSMADNFWGPTGNEGPCGPTTEIYANGLEVWNLVFNEYYRQADGELRPLDTRGVDTGMGLERLSMVVQGKNNIFETDLFEPLIQILPGNMPESIQRVIVDHMRASAFLISDGVVPSNKEQGYVLRRLMRRTIIQAHLNGIESEALKDILNKVVEIYSKYYPELNKELVSSEFEKENAKFQKTFKNGLAEMEKLERIDGSSAFRLFESFGLPYEIIKEVGKEKAVGLTRDDFDAEFKRHQEISRAGAEKKFGGHGIAAEGGDPVKVRLHTATHLVVAALEKVLGQKLPQAGSDITAERLRFDFTFPRKVMSEELKQAEDIANNIVAKDLPVTWEEMNTDDAFAGGASGAFRHKYGDRVKVYTIGDKNNPFSREICGGPHVTHTGEIGHITITKEESVSGGNRRIRAIIVD